MSKKRKPFIDLSLEGRVLLDEIDDYVDAWHKHPEGEPLHRYLGMKKSEYSLWVRDPDALPYIIKARHEERSLIEVVNDNYQEIKIAARARNSLKIKRLRAWLKEEGELD
jgi:hypothetical protein